MLNHQKPSKQNYHNKGVGQSGNIGDWPKSVIEMFKMYPDGQKRWTDNPPRTKTDNQMTKSH